MTPGEALGDDLGRKCEVGVAPAAGDMAAVAGEVARYTSDRALGLRTEPAREWCSGLGRVLAAVPG